ncbi:hypothetical protein NC652_003561 [Populus alba x Populus x berolinensis]|nr:hypothetical protein NC652_003561 [Populus alba x Populus x berolinensis]
MAMTSLTELDDDTVRSMSIGAVFSEFGGKINSIDFHRKDDLLVTASEDDSVRLYDIASAKLLKTTFHKKHGADRICFTHHPSSVICSSTYNLDSTGASDGKCCRIITFIYQCMIIDVFATSKGIKRGLFPSACLQSMIASCLVLLITALEYASSCKCLSREFCVYVVDPQLHMDQQGLVFSCGNGRRVLLSCLIHVLMTRVPLNNTFVSWWQIQLRFVGY